MTYPYPLLTPPKFIWNPYNVTEPKVHEWIKSISSVSEANWLDVDVTILGVPLSRSSISASAASETPDAMRRAWSYFTPYNLEEDIDLSRLNVVDLGDVREHVTDISYTHAQIAEAVKMMRTVHPNTFPIILGGDHSITAMTIKGWKSAHSQDRIGLLQIDTHFDLRSLEKLGPANGTPVRNLIESNMVRGCDVWNIGLHGFFNAKSLKEYADSVKLNYITLKELRKKGIENVLHEAFSYFQDNVDVVYLTVDMDVLDIAYAPGVPASTPGGMTTDELFHIVTSVGKNKQVQAMDIVCLDPQKDIQQTTIKAGVHVMLSFLTGFAMRKED